MIVKIDENGEVIKQVYFPPLQLLPPNYKIVNVDKYIPSNLKWNEKAVYDKIVREENDYFMHYKIEEVEKNTLEKRSRFLEEFGRLRARNKDFFQRGQIPQEQFDKNNLLLDMTNPEDETTYDLLEKLEFNMFAKIDSEGNVVEFPFIVPIGSQQEGVVEVDTEHLKPTNLKWYQAAWYDTVQKVEDKYCVTYTIGNKKFSSEEEKKFVFLYFIDQCKLQNDIKLSKEEITKEQYDQNLQILNNINVDDETHQDELDKITF